MPIYLFFIIGVCILGILRLILLILKGELEYISPVLAWELKVVCFFPSGRRLIDDS